MSTRTLAGVEYLNIYKCLRVTHWRIKPGKYHFSKKFIWSIPAVFTEAISQTQITAFSAARRHRITSVNSKHRYWWDHKMAESPWHACVPSDRIGRDLKSTICFLGEVGVRDCGLSCAFLLLFQKQMPLLKIGSKLPALRLLLFFFSVRLSEEFVKQVQHSHEAIMSFH